MDWLVEDGYWLARWLLHRSLGAVYLLAFLNILDQWRPLLGERGLTPVPDVVRYVHWRRQPSVFQWRYSDRLATALAWAGLVLSAAVVLGLPQAGPTWAPMVVWLALFGLYLSYVNVGQIWYAFGWESILLEAGFLAAFLGDADTAPPVLTVFLLRWLLFRVELGAGLIKLRGDPCWRQLTCLEYHHETQPLPSRFSWHFHHLPRSLHRVEVGANHVAQLVFPFLLFAPQPFAGAAGLAIIVTQSWLVISGNFAWLNALTMVLAVAALPAGWLTWLPASPPPALADPGWWFVVVVIAVTAWTVYASRLPVRNMLSSRQRMNASFNPLHLVGTYGAFGSITKVRYEVAIEGTLDEEPGANAEWREFGFVGKPGDPRRRPRQIAPYHLRLDWLMWFAAMSPSPGRHRWFGPLLARLLDGDDQVRRLLRHDPFDGEAPRAVRAVRYRYRYTTPRERRESGAWWVREPVGEFVPPTVLTRGQPTSVR